MKKNPNDNYYTTDNEMILEDDDTGEQYIFLIDRKNMLVIRSFLEEDIKPFILNYDGVTSKERREKKRVLYNELPKENSQYSYFVIEQIIGKPNKRDENSIYGLPRIPIGMGARCRATAVTEKPQDAIEMYIFTKYENLAEAVSFTLKKLADFFNIEGNAQIYPVI